MPLLQERLTMLHFKNVQTSSQDDICQSRTDEEEADVGQKIESSQQQEAPGSSVVSNAWEKQDKID